VIRKNTKLAFENENFIRQKPNSCKYDTIHINLIQIINKNFLRGRENYGNLLNLFLIHFIQLFLETSKEINYFKIKGAQLHCDISVIELDKLYKRKQRKFV